MMREKRDAPELRPDPSSIWNSSMHSSFASTRKAPPNSQRSQIGIPYVVRKNTRRCSGSGSRHCDGPCLCIRSCQRQQSANYIARRHRPETGCDDGTSQKPSQVREHHPGMCVYRPMCMFVYRAGLTRFGLFSVSHLSFSLFRPLQGLMAQKGLTRGQAEKRYGEFLADPDGFALKAAEEQRREKGEWNWQNIFLFIKSPVEYT